MLMTFFDPRVGPCLNELPGIIFQQDNSRSRTSVATKKTFHIMFSRHDHDQSDLSPIQHLYDQQKCLILACHSVYDLEEAVLNLGNNLPPIRRLFNLKCENMFGLLLQQQMVRYDVEITIGIKSESFISILMSSKFHFDLNIPS
ncbi:hypothetical protein TNIN_472351 [Trichonephila inaurata madagascariensis]|uniref:Uncharacterized protein n=1 Tax=Trichonephila inaurata madagascariensis TaxID=2747483 RepID=A0A8X7CAD4_9ARAC|nr:hypothetical protein TNIN_472351 [Trichonephila inaurata madagascariensis]